MMRGGTPKVRCLLLWSRWNRNIHSWVESQAIMEQTKELNFSNFTDAYVGHTTRSVLRSLGILHLCRIPLLVNHAEKLIASSQSAFGNRITDAMIRHTVFRHFCAGETSQEAIDIARSLQQHNIGGVFDCGALTPPPGINPSHLDSLLDSNMRSIEKSIIAAGMRGSTGKIAIKPTTLTKPDSLVKLNAFLKHLKQCGKLPNNNSFEDKFQRCMTMVKENQNNECFMKENDILEIMKLKQRIQSIATSCVRQNVRLMIDAEESEVQGAIDLIVLAVMERINQSEAWIWNTYQCYLKDTYCRLSHDLEAFASSGRCFGAKLVRGAYMKHETEQALKLGQDLPIFSNKSETDDAYNNAVHLLLDRMHRGPQIEVCIATHNQDSIQQATDIMKRMKVNQQQTPVYFAQIYGMSDYLTYALGHHHYKALKLLVYGDIHNVLPYLIRRAQENSDIIGGSHQDILAMQSLLVSRLFPILKEKN